MRRVSSLRLMRRQQLLSFQVAHESDTAIRLLKQLPEHEGIRQGGKLAEHLLAGKSGCTVLQQKRSARKFRKEHMQ
jgi:hypothetical protein